MHQDKPEEIVVITSQDGVWREEKVPLIGLGLISLAVKFEGEKDPDIERGWSPFQWGRMFKEKLYPGFEDSMKELRVVDDRITQFSKELNYLADLMPKDPTKLADIAVILIEIQQRLDSIVEAGSQVKPFKDRRVSDLYGRFHVKIPENLRTASEADDSKVATAGLIGDFVDFIGKAIFEYTDAETREMKRVVKHLLETTKQTISSVNRSLNEMLDARKTGDIDKYIELVKFVGKEQADLRKEFDVVYDAYLKEPYERALQLEAEAEEEAKARGEKYQKTHEEVSVGKDGIDVIEVDDPAPEEEDPLEAAEDAEKPAKEYGPPPSGLSMQPEDMPESEAPPTPPTVQYPVEEAHLVHPESGMAPSTIEEPIPMGEEPIPPTQRSQQLGVSPKAPSSKEMDILPGSAPIPQPEPESAPPARMLPSGEWSDKPKKQPEQPAGPKLRIEDIEPQLPPGFSARIEEALTKASHARFLDRLAKIAETENKYIIAAFMAKYSEELEDTNPKASAALLKAAQEMSND